MNSYSLDDLLYLMRRLRDPVDGCPWDKEQSFSSIVPFTIEETYELVDAIERSDLNQVREELGDVLFQVVFYSQLASENESFTFEQVVSTLVEKLVRRHPHVFPAGDLNSRTHNANTDIEQIKSHWEQIKSQERQQKSQNRALDDIPVSLPALVRASKLQKRAAQTGFDWDNIADVLNKLQEEIGELKDAITQNSMDDIEQELGDVLFSCVNVARHLQVDTESALRLTNRKFETRFAYIEDKGLQQGLSLEKMPVDRMNQLWEEAKKNGL